MTGMAQLNDVRGEKRTPVQVSTFHSDGAGTEGHQKRTECSSLGGEKRLREENRVLSRARTIQTDPEKFPTGSWMIYQLKTQTFLQKTENWSKEKRVSSLEGTRIPSVTYEKVEGRQDLTERGGGRDTLSFS